MLEILNDYDWEEAFAYSSGIPGSKNAGIPQWVPESAQSGAAEPFGREDVAEIVGLSNGENDGDDWIAYGRLKDGRWFFLSAGCDYTGWDCQAGGHAVVAETREHLERLGMTQPERTRMDNQGCCAHDDCKATPELARACFVASLTPLAPVKRGTP